MIVVDTNVLADFWLPGNRTAAAERLLSLDPDWRVPLLWRSEFRSVLTLAVKHKRCSLRQAIEIAERAHEQQRGRELVVDSADVLGLSVKSGCSAYDCEFVALALMLDVPLITSDRQVLRAFPRVAISTEDYAP